jgi:hypothetical protein
MNLEYQPPVITATAKRRDERYDIQNAGPIVKEKAAKLVGRAISIARPNSVIASADKPEIHLNGLLVVKSMRSEASVSGITSAADQYNSPSFDEASTMKTYKKMLPLFHLKDEMASIYNQRHNVGVFEEPCNNPMCVQK